MTYKSDEHFEIHIIKGLFAIARGAALALTSSDNVKNIFNSEVIEELEPSYTRRQLRSYFVVVAYGCKQVHKNLKN